MVAVHRHSKSPASGVGACRRARSKSKHVAAKLEREFLKVAVRGTIGIGINQLVGRNLRNGRSEIDTYAIEQRFVVRLMAVSQRLIPLRCCLGHAAADLGVGVRKPGQLFGQLLCQEHLRVELVVGADRNQHHCAIRARNRECPLRVSRHRAALRDDLELALKLDLVVRHLSRERDRVALGRNRSRLARAQEGNGGTKCK